MLKISVIIPVYNTEKYLTQCLDSVINQTYKNLEIICVDDCSTDNSREVLQNYAQKDDRIKIVYNKNNSKLGVSRNNGFNIATGDYIHFLDSDDWMELNAYEKMVATTTNKPDIIYFYYQEVSEIDNNITKYLSENPSNINKLIKINDDYRKNIEFTEQVWNKLYSKEFLNKYNLLHNEYPCFEDMEFSLKIRIFANTIYYLNDILINYRTHRKNSLIANGSKHLDYIIKSYLNAEKWCSDLIDWKIGKHLLAGQFYLLKSKKARLILRAKDKSRHLR